MTRAPSVAPSPHPLDAAKRQLRRLADPSRVEVLRSFFKTGPGQYGEGDVFIGVTVPNIRLVCRACTGITLADVAALLQSEIHEERLLALLVLVDRFKREAAAGRRAIYAFYLAQAARINNWDLVDTSAAPIVGGYLADRSRAPLTRLARSSSLWERRIAIVATHFFIRRGEVDETFRIADLLLDDRHDLMHKATGWMLREAGKQDASALRRYLATRAHRMPRTMLRYAIERFEPDERRRWLLGTNWTDQPPASTRGRSAASSTKSSSPVKASGAKRKPKP